MSDIEARLAARWLAANGRSHVDAAIDPADAMYRAVERYGVPQHRRALAYLRDGAHALETLEHALACAGKPLSASRRVLEFAAGHGRTTRFLVHEVDPANVVVSDILGDALDWNTRRFGVRGIVSDFEPERVDLRGPFDVIFVASLFSHLPAARFAEWLVKLYGALDDDGVLLFSVHGEAATDAPGATSAFTFRAESEIARLPVSEYGSTFARPAAVRDIAAACGIEHVRHVERDLWGAQDVYAVTRREMAGLDSWSGTPRVFGSIDRIGALDRDRVGLAGVVRWSGSAPAVAEVRAALDGVDMGPLALGPAFVVEPAHRHRVAVLAREFHAVGARPPGALGLHLVDVTALDESGARTCFDVEALDLTSNA